MRGESDGRGGWGGTARGTIRYGGEVRDQGPTLPRPPPTSGSHKLAEGRTGEARAWCENGGRRATFGRRKAIRRRMLQIFTQGGRWGARDHNRSWRRRRRAAASNQRARGTAGGRNGGGYGGGARGDGLCDGDRNRV